MNNKNKKYVRASKGKYLFTNKHFSKSDMGAKENEHRRHFSCKCSVSNVKRKSDTVLSVASLAQAKKT
jgi:hypothetical protein